MARRVALGRRPDNFRLVWCPWQHVPPFSLSARRVPRPFSFLVLVHPALQIPQGIAAEPEIVRGERAGRETPRALPAAAPRLPARAVASARVGVVTFAAAANAAGLRRGRPPSSSAANRPSQGRARFRASLSPVRRRPRAGRPILPAFARGLSCRARSRPSRCSSSGTSREISAHISRVAPIAAPARACKASSISAWRGAASGVERPLVVVPRLGMRAAEQAFKRARHALKRLARRLGDAARRRATPEAGRATPPMTRIGCTARRGLRARALRVSAAGAGALTGSACRNARTAPPCPPRRSARSSCRRGRAARARP